MKTFYSHAPEETEQLGADFAQQLLASGRCHRLYRRPRRRQNRLFPRHPARSCGYSGRVTSPTFAIVSEYHTEKADVAHFDMYRILDVEALWELGFDEYLDGSRIVLIEWSENIAEALSPHKLVSIRYGAQPDDRIITITEEVS